LEEIEKHKPDPDSLLNDFDCEIIGDDDDCQLLGSFKPETLLYNLKKEIKVDRQDLGQNMLKNVKTIETKVKMEQADNRTNGFNGKTISVKREQKMRVKGETSELSAISTVASTGLFDMSSANATQFSTPLKPYRPPIDSKPYKRVKTSAYEFMNPALTPDMRMNTDEVSDCFQNNVRG